MKFQFFSLWIFARPFATEWRRNYEVSPQHNASPPHRFWQRHFNIYSATDLRRVYIFLIWRKIIKLQGYWDW